MIKKSDDLKKESWGIVGGGILGMTLAYKLQKLGYKVTLLEAGKNPGGLADAWQINGFTWDRFYHVILSSDKFLLSLLNELGLLNKINWVETKTGFYSDGKLYSVSDSIEFLKFPPINLIDKARLGFSILYASRVKNWKKLEEISVESWLKKISGKNVFHKIWLPLLKSKLGDLYKETSASFIWATIQRMYAARRSGLKKEMFGYVEGGYSTIIKRFTGVLAEKVSIKTNCAVKNVESYDSKIKIEFSENNYEIFDKVILTLPSEISEKVCKNLTDEERKKLKGTKYIGIICPSVLTAKSLSPFYITNIIDSGFPFTGIIEMTNVVNKKYFNGNSLIYLPKYISPDDTLLNMPDEYIEKLFIENLLKMYPHFQRKDIVSIQVARAKHVFALPVKKYSENLPEIKTSVPGLFILNSSHIVNGTLNVNETIQLAEKKLELILNNFDTL